MAELSPEVTAMRPAHVEENCNITVHEQFQQLTLTRQKEEQREEDSYVQKEEKQPSDVIGIAEHVTWQTGVKEGEIVSETETESDDLAKSVTLGLDECSSAESEEYEKDKYSSLSKTTGDVHAAPPDSRDSTEGANATLKEHGESSDLPSQNATAEPETLNDASLSRKTQGKKCQDIETGASELSNEESEGDNSKAAPCRLFGTSKTFADVLMHSPSARKDVIAAATMLTKSPRRDNDN